MRKSNGWITNSLEASRDCGSTSYIILSICIVHWEQQQSHYFEIKTNLEGENKLTVYHIVERKREFVLGNNQYSCMSSNWVSPVFLQDVTVTTVLLFLFDGFGCVAAVNRVHQKWLWFVFSIWAPTLLGPKYQSGDQAGQGHRCGAAWDSWGSQPKTYHPSISSCPQHSDAIM